MNVEAYDEETYKGNNLHEVASRDTTFDKTGLVERIWLTVNNRTEKEDYLEIILEVNGVEKVIQSHWIPGLDKNEGHTLHSTNLTWLLSHGKETR